MKDNIFHLIANEIDKGRAVSEVIITKKQGSSPSKLFGTMYVFENREIIGTVGGGISEKALIDLAIECMEKGEDCTFNKDYSLKNDLACGGTVEGFIKVYLPKKKIIIFGSGHIGRSVCDVLKLLDFDITVVDDRAEYKELACFSDIRYIDMEIKEAVNYIGDFDNSYIVITTRSHFLDTEVLFNLQNFKPKYIGMIGSKKKKITVFQQLQEKGVSERFLDKVFCPIGYKFDNGTPKEIAISIVSQILEVKNNKDG